jgi:hypothetical protein
MLEEIAWQQREMFFRPPAPPEGIAAIPPAGQGPEEVAPKRAPDFRYAMYPLLMAQILDSVSVPEPLRVRG